MSELVGSWYGYSKGIYIVCPFWDSFDEQMIFQTLLWLASVFLPTLFTLPTIQPYKGRSLLGFLSNLHNNKLLTKSRLYISVAVPWQAFIERSPRKEMVFELAFKIRRQAAVWL